MTLPLSEETRSRLLPGRVRFARRFLALAAGCAMSASPMLQAAPRALSQPYPTVGSVDRVDPALDALIAPGVGMEKVAEGFRWSEGPVWMPAEQRLCLSDVPANMSYQWSESGGLGVFLAPSGYTGPYDGEPHQGSNGMILDQKGRLLLCQHGDRRVARLEAGCAFTTLADRFEGKRFSSPNDLCCTHDGVIFFTDPPYGLTGLSEKPELDFAGVFRVDVDGTVTLVTRELDRPNGIGLSPDDKTLYVTSSDPKNPIVIALDLLPGGGGGPSRVLFDGRPLCQALGRDRPMDGMTVDEKGNLWSAGPGGIVIISPEGVHLGTLLTGRDTANCAFGGSDGSDLFITASDTLLRIRTKVKGAGFN